LIVLGIVISGVTVLQAMGGKPAKKVVQTKETKVKKDVKTTKLSKAKDPAQQLLKEGDKYFQKREFDKAIEKYQKVVNDYPGHSLAPEALLRTGACYALQYKWNEAINSAKNVIEKYPYSTQAMHSYYNIANAYAVLKDYKNAIKYYKMRLEKYPEKGTETGMALFELSVIYYRNKNYDQSIKMAQKLIEDYPECDLVKSKTVLCGIGECYQQEGKIDEAIEIYKTVLTTSYKKVINLDVVTFQIAELYAYKENYAQAKIWFQKVIDKYPKSEWAEKAKRRLKQIQGK
jgi:TolA-binding protein